VCCIGDRCLQKTAELLRVNNGLIPSPVGTCVYALKYLCCARLYAVIIMQTAFAPFANGRL